MNNGTPFSSTDLSERLKGFSDLELLLELSSRKRLMQVDYHTICPSHAVDMGFPREKQIIETFENVGREIGIRVASGNSIPNCVFSHEESKIGLIGKKDRKFKAQLTFVVNKK